MCQTPLVCGPISRTQTSVPLTRAKPLPKAIRRGIKRSCLFTTQSDTKASPFPSLRVHSKHEGTNVKCKPNCAPSGTLSKTRLASCSGGILAGFTGGELLRLDTGRILGRIHRERKLSGTLGGIHRLFYSGGIRDPLASYSGILAGCSGGILGGIHWRAALAGYSAGRTGEPLWRDTGEQLWRGAGRDPLASSSGGIHWPGGILGGIHWLAALAGYWVWARCRSIANADSNIKSNNPFLSGGEQKP